ncbi:retrovirus-related pol polyprotein from transposon TNT 1-94 [Tanacetum coccineum]
MAHIQEVTPDATDNSGPIFDAEPLQKQPEFVNDTNPDEQGDTNIPTDSLDMSNNGGQADQDEDDDLARECDLLASLIDKLKCKIDESKNHNKLLELSNKNLVDKLKDLKKFQAELDRYHDVNYSSKVEIDCAKAKGDLIKLKDESYLKAQLQDKDIAISALKKLIEKMKGKSVETKLKKSSVIRQTDAFKSQRQSILGVIPTTSVSRPQLKSNRLEDKVMHNNSEGKKQQVEDHRRNFRFSNNKTPITACNDSLNAKTSNVNVVCVTCGKCMLNENHDMCVLHYINGMNSRTKMPMAMPREPKQTVNQSAATPLKRTVAIESTNQKPRSIIRKQYEQISKTCKWWYCKITPPGYKWKPKSSVVNVEPNVSMHLGSKSRTTNILESMTLRKSTHMTGNLKLLSNFVEKFLGTVKFGNDQIASILGYGDLVQGNVTIMRVYYVEGLNHNLFSVGQFYDADLEVAFRKSTCYIRDLKGNDLLTGSRGTDLYSITLQDTSTPNLICLMAKASSSQAWLWHHRLSYLNFDTINLLSKYDIVSGLTKLKFVKDHLCSSCELRKAKRKSFKTKNTPSSKRRLQILYMDLCGPMRVESFNGKNYVLVIVDDYLRYNWTHFLRSKDETPGVLIDFLKLVQRGLHAQGEAITTTCFTRKCSLVIPRHEKTPGSLCYIIRDGENLDKMKEKSLSPSPKSQENVPQAAETVTMSNELDLLFSLMFDELLNGTTQVVSKSSAVTTADAHNQRQ